MAVPLSQMFVVTSHVLKQKLRGRGRYPLVLMLEPLMRCNLACAGCGKIQYPDHILKRRLSPEECFAAAEECGAPIVSIPGGEPLMHPQIGQIVAGLIERKKYVYLCTNALLMKQKLDLFKPNRRFSFSVHLDGLREAHDFAVCREGTWDIAVEAIREALRRGFRVTTNTTLFDGAAPEQVRQFFHEAMNLGVEGMMISPGYSYDRAPDQEHFLGRRKARKLFANILNNRPRRWRFNQSPLFLEFLMGLREYSCTPWGMPTYNVFGWQKPCYLLQDGYATSFAELMESTQWDRYGWESGNPRCANCMVHSGYEASAVAETFGSLRGLFATIRSILWHRNANSYPDDLLELDRSKPLHFVEPTIGGQTLSQRSAEQSLQGKIRLPADERELRETIEEAFNYRGDVTIFLKDSRRLDGYVSDRRSDSASLSASSMKILLKQKPETVVVSYDQIAKIEFSGRDTATGERFVHWLSNYQRRHATEVRGSG